MSNITLVESPWSSTLTLTTGFPVGVKPKKSIIGKFSIDQGVTTDIRPFTIGNDIYGLYFNETNKLSIGKYNPSDGTFSNYSTSTINFSYPIFTNYENMVYILLGDFPNTKLMTFNITSKVWDEIIVDNTVCLFNAYTTSLVVRPILTDGSLTNVEIFVAGANKDTENNLNTPPLLVKYDKNLNTWSNISFDGLVIEGNPEPTCPKVWFSPSLVRHNDGFFWHNGITSSYLWYYNCATGTFTLKNSIASFIHEKDYILSLLPTGTSLISVIETYLEPDYKDLSFRYFKEYDTETGVWDTLQEIPSSNEIDMYFTNVGRTLYGINFNYNKIFTPEITEFGLIPKIKETISNDFTNAFEFHFNDNIHMYHIRNEPGNTEEYIYKYQVEENTDLIVPHTYEKIKVVYPTVIQAWGDCAHVFYNGFLYKFGGTEALKLLGSGDPGAPTNNLFKIDITTGVATLIDSTGEGSYLSTIIAKNDKLYFIGGIKVRPGSVDQNNQFYGPRYYDLLTNTWTIIPEPVNEYAKKYQVTALEQDDNIYFINGNSLSTSISSSDCKKYLIKWNLSTNEITKLSDLPIAGENYEYKLFHHNNSMYLLMNPDQNTGNIYKFYTFNTTTNTETLAFSCDATTFIEVPHKTNTCNAISSFYDKIYIFGAITNYTTTNGYTLITTGVAGYNILRLNPSNVSLCDQVIGNRYENTMRCSVIAPYCTNLDETMTELEYRVYADWFLLNQEVSLEYDILNLGVGKTLTMLSDGYPFKNWVQPIEGDVFIEVRMKGNRTLWSPWVTGQFNIPPEEPSEEP